VKHTFSVSFIIYFYSLLKVSACSCCIPHPAPQRLAISLVLPNLLLPRTSSECQCSSLWGVGPRPCGQHVHAGDMSIRATCPCGQHVHAGNMSIRATCPCGQHVCSSVFLAWWNHLAHDMRCRQWLSNAWSHRIGSPHFRHCKGVRSLFLGCSTPRNVVTSVQSHYLCSQNVVLSSWGHKCNFLIQTLSPLSSWGPGSQ
jgi:hypothetical protein